MPANLIAFCVIAVILRLTTLAISIRHERALKANGAVEIGAGNSTLLALTHIAFYVAAIVEGSLRADAADIVTWLGLALYVFSMLVLLMVIRLLGRFWTVKLLIAQDHELVTHPLFRWVRHPNYFLNILPELVGFALALHAWATLVVGLVLYAVPLTIRIRQEEKAMAARFERY
ncbi:MAG TPA: isoprenylcysteine carboxyl methyltransferase family protein [Terriglobia bacterium]|nr:isoprenylcysteine carboxyl methyltransferase family protein [Terriglobia bacterium]